MTLGDVLMNCNAKMSRSKKGFTLVELLIVVAIIAVLVAIAIPVYSTQLEESREAVDEANLQTVKTLAQADWMLEQSDIDRSQQVYYTIKTNNDGTLDVDATNNTNALLGGEWQSKKAKETENWADSQLCIDSDGTIIFG